ncbi:MAG: MFS transporter [Planctomycetota bacterium]
MSEPSLHDQVRRARRNFLAMAGSYSLGVFNDNFFKQAVMLLAVAADRPRVQGHAIVIFSLPYLAFAAYAGWMADRFSKRRIVIAAKFLELAAMIAGAIGITSGNWPLILLMLGLMGLQSSLFSPSLNGSIPELYPASYVPTANAYLKAAVTCAILAGIACAGFALDRDSPSLAGIPLGRVLVAAVAVVVALLGALASFGVPRRPAASPGAAFPVLGPFQTLVELWRIRTDRLLAGVVLSNVFIWFAGSLVILLINFFAMVQLSLGKAFTSTLVVSQLIGLALGGLTAGRLAARGRPLRVLPPAALAMGAVMVSMLLLPLLPERIALVASFFLLPAMGFAGGLFMIPCEAFVQVRPPPGRKGTVIAASNFAVFLGILISGPIFNLLCVTLKLRPTTGFALLGGLAFVVGLLLLILLSTADRKPLNNLLRLFARLLLFLRYRVQVRGLDAVLAHGNSGILFLPNHPALIDPVILAAVLHKHFAPRVIADRNQVDRPVIRFFARRIGVRTIPDLALYGPAAREGIRAVLEESIRGLEAGENLLLYPAGHAYRSRFEDLRGNSGAHTVLSRAAGARVVLVRTSGLWGSSFSWASGSSPNVARALTRGALSLLASGVFFAPRRDVTIEFVEPDDLPRSADRETLNRRLEAFYNADALPNTYVPYSLWEGGGRRVLSEPAGPIPRLRDADLSAVPDATRSAVLSQLERITGAHDIREEMHLARDLGLDSLSRVELLSWLQSEFGFLPGDVETLQTVADALLAASGRAISSTREDLKSVPTAWFRPVSSARIAPLPNGATITQVFLAQAERFPSRIAIADQVAGAKTYRDLITAILLLTPALRPLAGKRLAIMLPAGVAADLVYLSSLFAGKTPVLVNWTVGSGSIVRCLDLVGAEKIVTARALTARLSSQGYELSGLEGRFVHIEDLARSFSVPRKLAAAVRARVSWKALRRASVPDTAAILFTSGSETLPKAVPLSHENILSNLRDVTSVITIRQDDSLAGILPPFHSFGLTVTMVLPLCLGVPAFYHPNPTEGPRIARLIRLYRGTLLMGTPTFLAGILRACTPDDLDSLRLVVTGAEKCPDALYRVLSERLPRVTVLEGFGVTECSPIISVNDEERPSPGTIGRILPSLEYAVLDPNAPHRVAPGTPGVLLVRGPSVFAGYLNHEGEPPFLSFEGKLWYRTADLISESREGVLTFHGRLKRFIKLGGEMLSLPAIEAALSSHFPPLADDRPSFAVEATLSPEHPEIVLFCVRPADRETVNRLIRSAGLSPLHNVRRVISLDSIPALATGKTDYRSLRDLLREAAD